MPTIIPYSENDYGKHTRNILGRFCFYFRLVFYILGALFIKQLFHPRLLDMRCSYPARRCALCRLWPTCASGTKLLNIG